MVVDKETANWRLFGGGGLLVGGLLWLIGVIVSAIGPAAVGHWFEIIGVLLVGIALLFVAFGQTGSNGAVGASLLGKVVLVVFGLGWIILGVVMLLGALTISTPAVLQTIVAVLVVVGGVLSAVVIYQRGVARGIARWIIALPVIWTIVWAIHVLGWVTLFDPAVLAGVLAALFALTGLAYVLNRKG